MITSILILIFLLILFLPLLVKKVEHNLELFLLVTGGTALVLSHFLGPEPLLSLRLIESVFMEPVTGNGNQRPLQACSIPPGAFPPS